ncbi:hypothetical protein DFH09DRAFT_1082872 [Mycena vulgaris]|nr:hypothetical protein DFH09DRAFT_1082872 [Mycena vulgaris]
MYMQYEPRTRFATLHASEQYPKRLQWLRLNRVIRRVEPDRSLALAESRIWVDTTDSADAMYISSQSAWKRCWISKTSSEKGAGPKRVVNVLDICHITSFEIAPREKIYVKLSTYPEIWPVKIEGAVRGCLDLCLDSLYYIPESSSNEDHR